MNPAGHSLIELLVVLAVIGLITAIGVPILGDFNDSAASAKNKVNARTASSICSSASVAGYDFVANATHPTSQLWVLRAITAGTTINDPASPFHGNFFGLPNLNEDQIYGAQAYLNVVDGELIYNAAGDSVDPVVPVP